MSKFRAMFEPKTLIELSGVEICKKLWTHSSIRESMKLKVKNFIVSKSWCNPLECDSDEEILNHVFHNLNKLPLPSSIKNDLKILTKKMEFVLLACLNDIHHGSSMSVPVEEYIDHMKWTKDGDIDKAETLRSMYYAKVLPDSDDTWMQLTNSCLEDCITDYYQRMKSLNCPPIEGNLWEILPAYWIQRLENRLQDLWEILPLSLWKYRNENRQKGCFQESDDDGTMKEILLRVAIFSENHSAAKYFWDSLDEDQRIRTIQVFTEEQLLTIAYDTVVYFWGPASVYGIDSFFINIFHDEYVMERLIRWPYEDLLMTTLEKFLPQLNEYELEEILYDISRLVSDDIFGDHIGKISLIFQQVWKRLGEDYKSVMNCRYCLCKVRHCMEILKCIINDPALTLTRNMNINYVATLYKSESTYNDTRGLVTEFCEVVLKSESERQAFRRRL